MNIVLPHQGNRSAHLTAHYGEQRAKGPHGGSDFNYEGGQTGINLTHPTVHSSVSGEVTFVGGQYGTIKIKDAEGNSHEILHTQTQSVTVGQKLTVGEEIGTMGGRGPNGGAQYAQHVHYQMKDSQGRPVNPEEFWSQRPVQTSTGPHTATVERTPHAHLDAKANGLLKHGERGTEVQALQTALNKLGYTDVQGKTLQADGDFGANTKHAVEAFQHDHGLKVDGIAGPKTLEAIHHQSQRQEPRSMQTPSAPLSRLDDAKHPDHAMYRQALSAVHQMDAEQRRTPDQHSNNLAAALVVAARRDGLSQIHHAALSDDATRTFAVQGELRSPLKQITHVQTAEAINTPVEKSSAAWDQTIQQKHKEQAQLTQQQEQHPQTSSRTNTSPGM
ncbi:XVIPCD domain-containing protein [Dyella tabacisoli]|nr:XVIPCD domain-containing protein [Dyella tabacisoli]